MKMVFLLFINILLMVFLILVVPAACYNDFSLLGTDSVLKGNIIIIPARPVVGQELTAIYNGSETVNYQWNRNETAISGSNTNKYTPIIEGNYTVTVSTADKSKTSTAVNVIAITELSGNITINPNTGVSSGTELTATYSGWESVSYQWKRDGNIVPGGTGNKYVPMMGTITVTVYAGTKNKTSEAVNVSNGTVTSQVISNGKTYDVNGGTTFRMAADARIELIRKDNMTVTVIDSNDNPVNGADIQIKMTKHEFLFGGAVNGTNFISNEVRKRQFLDLFNAAVFENYMKWKHDENNLTITNGLLQWLLNNGIPVRGHALIWGGWDNLPEGYQDLYQNNPTVLKQLTLDRINQWIPYWGNRVTEWDVVNEAYGANDIQSVLGYNMRNDTVLANANVVDEWFIAAKNEINQNNLNLKLFYNDYELISARGTGGTSHRTWFEKFMGGLIARKVPIDGIGCQLYIQTPYNTNTSPNAEFIYECLQNLEKYNLEIKITEFGYNETANNNALQAINFIDMLTAAYSHPMTTSFIVWWPWNTIGGIYPNAGYFDENNKIKPMGEAFAYLIYDKWWTNEKGKTGIDGKYNTTGYFGEYNIIVTHNDITEIFQVKMLKNNGERNFTVKL